MLKSWMVIAAVTFGVALIANILRPKDVKWFKRQERPRWLTFEKLIPVIWTIVFICGGWSAYIVWEQNPGAQQTWFLMAFYVLVELVIVAYTPATLWLHSLKVGTYVGAFGFALGFLLTLLVLQQSAWAALLLLPYLIWAPIGTYTTWSMYKLNEK